MTRTPARRMTKRGNASAGYGNGTVQEIKEGSGKWRARFEGKDYRAASEAAAWVKLATLQERRKRRLTAGTERMTVATLLITWLDAEGSTLRVKTLQGYQDTIRRYITPTPIAKLRIGDVSPEHIRTWLRDFTSAKRTNGKGYASDTISGAYNRLHRAFAFAVEERYLDFNPVALAKKHKPRAASVSAPVVLEEQEAAHFIAAFAGNPYQPFMATALMTGMRVGELCGLRWSDIELPHARIAVRGQLQKVKGADGKRQLLYQPSTKTRAGERTIDIPDELTVILRLHRRQWSAQRLEAGAAWAGGEYAFVSEEGNPLDSSNLNRAVRRGLKRAGITRRASMHDLRHTAGSLMLARGAQIEAVSEILGHSSSAVTARIYAHALKSRKRETGRMLGDLLQKVAS